MPHKGYKQTLEHKSKVNKIRIGNKYWLGKTHTNESREKIKKFRTGIKLSEETRLKMSIKKTGEKSHFWKGGKTSENKTIRESIEYKIWREHIFLRDKYTCKKCKKAGDELNAHHIKSFNNYIDLRFKEYNGITLCKKCHKIFHKENGKHKNTFNQLFQYLIKPYKV